MKKYYLSSIEIKSLKYELMKKNNKDNNNKEKSLSNKSKNHSSNRSVSYYSSKDIPSEYYKLRNGEIGLDFEENIRQILYIDYKWKKGLFNRNFYYREITVKKKTKIVLTNETIKFKIKNNNIIFKLNPDKSLEVNINNKVTKIMHPKETSIEKFERKIQIKKLNEVEMDGMFEINNFSPSIFDKEEVSIIHQNVEDIKLKQFTQAVIEIKLSKAKFGDLVTQLYRDKEIIEK